MMRIDRMRLEDGALVELFVSSDLFEGARVPLEALTQNERLWFSKLARAIEDGDERSRSLLLEAVQGAILVDPRAKGLQKRGGDSPA